MHGVVDLESAERWGRPGGPGVTCLRVGSDLPRGLGWVTACSGGGGCVVTVVGQWWSYPAPDVGWGGSRLGSLANV